MMKRVVGKLPDIYIEIHLPEDIPLGDAILLVRKLQEFVNQFDTEEEFQRVMMEAVKNTRVDERLN